MIQRQNHIVTIAVLLLSSCTISTVQAQAGTLLWSDEFNTTGSSSSTTIDASYWTARTGNNNGWGNGELQIYTSDVQNVAIQDNEYLAITVLEHLSTDNTTPAVRTFSSGRIDTYEKVHIKYGTISAKIQIPNVDAGLWPAFWTLGAVNASFPFPSNGEMDIMEVGQGLAIEEGLGNRRSISGAHWERDGAYTTMAGSRDFSSNLNDTFFVYTLDWTPFNITTYVNDDQVWTMDTSDANCADCEEFHRFHYLLLNVAVGGGFTSGSGSSSSGSSSSSSGCGSSSGGSSGSSGSGCTLRTPEDITAPLPATMKVDWVRIFDNGYSDIVIVDDGQVTTPTAPTPVAVTAPVPVPVPVEASTPVVAPVPVPVEAVAPVIAVPTSVVAPVPAAVAPSLIAPVASPTEDENIFFPRPSSNGGSGKGGKGGKGGGKGGDGDSNSSADSAVTGGSAKTKSGKSKKGKSSSSEQNDLSINSAGISTNRHQVVTTTCTVAMLAVAMQQWVIR